MRPGFRELPSGLCRGRRAETLAGGRCGAWFHANFGPMTGGVVAVIAVFALTRSVVGATLAGSLAFGMVFAWLAS